MFTEQHSFEAILLLLSSGVLCGNKCTSQELKKSGGENRCRHRYPFLSAVYTSGLSAQLQAYRKRQ